MKCGNCGEISEKWQYIRLMDSVALKGGRGSASMVQKCKLCTRENSIDILSSTIKPYNAEDNEKFKTIVEFECRGLEPVDFQPQAGFAAEGVESGTVFSDINLQEKPKCRALWCTCMEAVMCFTGKIHVRIGLSMMKRPRSLWESMRSPTSL
ncbi:CXXC motif containing zinc binding protein isoform X2 [Nycticebus coucang]|nr:CXXC motif containing zinc binding protein isoform X2 [Nycticebus coucang]XP_053432513.1 CXXC motif containing zinc binding protein isoform X2 [Nycticebus coucang]